MAPARPRRALSPAWRLLGAALLALAVWTPGNLRADGGTPRPHSIFVVNHGRHTGIILRRTDAVAAGGGVWPALPEFAREKYLEIGWGSEPFYTARRITLPIVLRTMFTATPSVLHADGFRGSPAAAFPGLEIVRLEISAAGWRELSARLGGAFARDARGAAVDLGPGLYGHSRFYRAKGRYTLFNNCNTWTADALREAGNFPLHGLARLLASRLMAQLRPRAAAGAEIPVTDQSESPPNGRGRRDLRGR